MPPTTVEIAQVTALLGREPRADFEVVVRAPHGEPMVIRNEPFLHDGTPMPTRYWLVDRELVAEVSRVESTGGCKRAEAAIPATDVIAVHRRYREARDAQIAPDHEGPLPSGGVGGTAHGVKCLHAHLAYHLAGGDDPVGRWVAAQLECESA